MTLEKFSGILIILAIIIVPCIPGLWLAYCFFRDVIKVIKEGLDEYTESEDRITFVDEYLQEQLEKQDKIRELGLAGYYMDKAKTFWKEYSFVFYAIGMILFLMAAMFRRGISLALRILSQVPVADILWVVVTALEILVLLYYIFCKKHRGKWKSAIALMVIVAVKQLGTLAYGSFHFSIDTACYLMLFLAVHHYEQWKQELAAQREVLHQKLAEVRYADDALLHKYLMLQHHRQETGEKETIFRKLREDDEADEILHYLNWLETRTDLPEVPGESAEIKQNEVRE